MKGIDVLERDVFPLFRDWSLIGTNWKLVLIDGTGPILKTILFHPVVLHIL